MPRNLLVLFGLAAVVVASGCPKPKPPPPPTPANIYPQSGDNQSAVAGQALANPLIVLVADTNGNAMSGVTVNWAATNGKVANPTSTTDGSGRASNTATVGTNAGPASFVASVTGVSNSVTFVANAEHGFVYTAPAVTGTTKIKVVQNAASTTDVMVLDVVATAAMQGFTVAMNLPVDASKVEMHSTPILPGTTLNPGTNPVAAAAVLPASGPNSGIIISGQSQKAAGAGSTAADSAIPAGAVLYSIQLDRIPGAAAGTVFDGSALPTTFRAGLRNKAGTDQATSNQVAVGKLVLE